MLYIYCRSTEVVVLEVLGNILCMINSGDLAVLMLLDLSMSAAFYTVDHSTLIRHLKISYGFDVPVFD
jgi:hypothetical protein